MRLAVRIDVLAGAFASQQLAFAHLLDAAEAAGLSPDLDHVEVILAPYGARLAAYFDSETAARIAEAAEGDAVILILPGALVTGAFGADARLRRIGVFDGRMVRA